MKCRYKISDWNRTNRLVKISKCKIIKGLVKVCDEEKCDYINKLKKKKN